MITEEAKPKHNNRLPFVLWVSLTSQGLDTLTPGQKTELIRLKVRTKGTSTINKLPKPPERAQPSGQGGTNDQCQGDVQNCVKNNVFGNTELGKEKKTHVAD